MEAEPLRVHLLDAHQIGLIATANTDLRVAFSCLEVEQIEPLFDVGPPGHRRNCRGRGVRLSLPFGRASYRGPEAPASSQDVEGRFDAEAEVLDRDALVRAVDAARLAGRRRRGTKP